MAAGRRPTFATRTTPVGDVAAEIRAGTRVTFAAAACSAANPRTSCSRLVAAVACVASRTPPFGAAIAALEACVTIDTRVGVRALRAALGCVTVGFRVGAATRRATVTVGFEYRGNTTVLTDTAADACATLCARGNDPSTDAACA